MSIQRHDLPESLRVVINKCNTALAEDPRGQLRLGLRQSVWAAMGARPAIVNQRLRDIESRITMKGYRRRVRLAVAGMRKVLPIWEHVWPNDDTPHRLLEVAEKLMDNRITDDDAIRTSGLLVSHCFNLSYRHPEHELVTMLGDGSSLAIKTAGIDEDFDPADIDPNLKDDYTLDATDSASVAATIWANGGPWMNDSDDAKRCEYWTWWLDEAVPDAWASESE